jgi:hypothetical protein
MRDLPVTIAHEPIPMFRLRIINKFRCVTYTKSTDSDVSPTYDQSIPMFPCVVCYSSIYGFWLPLWYLPTLLSPTYLQSIPMFSFRTTNRFRCFSYVHSSDSDVSPTYNHPIPMFHLRTINRFRCFAYA